MSNVRNFPSRDDRRLEEAGDWIAALERGITEEEEQSLGSWLATDEANYTTFMELAELWDQMDALGRLSALFPEPPAQRRSPSGRAILGIAASVIFAVTLVVIFQSSDQRVPATDEEIALIAAATYETSIGEQASHELVDGTVLLLNTHSRVRAEFTATNRVLILDRGEIHVKVAKDPDRRLSVLVGNKLVQAVGTEFNVEVTHDQSIELVVTEGVVMVGIIDKPIDELPPDTPLLLTQAATIVGAGEQAVIMAGDSSAETLDAERIERDEIAVKLSWRDGNLIFRGESLEEAVAEVGRYTAVEFVFVDEKAKKVRVAGLFKAGDVEGLLAALRNHFNISYEWQGDDRILLRADRQDTAE